MNIEIRADGEAAAGATESSQRIVSFIGSLLPLYVPESHDKNYCARSLRDGTLVMPMAETPEDEDGWVRVHWQGDRARATPVQGIFLVRLALSDYVDFMSRGKPERYIKEFAALAEHFELKTSRTLAQPEDWVVQFMEATSAGIEKLGKEGLIALIKKAVGL
ncbi:MAG TPA: hypothetical protein VFE23_10610 [Usitatibacter sp.]|jgi:hypothetical protein|nr:hypothetical protein [Usitatibacter sp.]